MVVGILAVLKTGGCYVPLDPVYPKERLAFILEDARPKLLLTDKNLLDILPPAVRWIGFDSARHRNKIALSKILPFQSTKVSV